MASPGTRPGASSGSRTSPTATARTTSSTSTATGARGPAPTIVWVHGGAFVGGSKEELRHWFELLADEGYTVVAPRYSLAPESTYPTPVRQVVAVLGHVCAHAGRLRVDPERQSRQRGSAAAADDRVGRAPRRAGRRDGHAAVPARHESAALARGPVPPGHAGRTGGAVADPGLPGPARLTGREPAQARITELPSSRSTSAATSLPRSPARKPWWCSPRTMTSARASRAASMMARPGSPAAHMKSA